MNKNLTLQKKCKKNTFLILHLNKYCLFRHFQTFGAKKNAVFVKHGAANWYELKFLVNLIFFVINFYNCGIVQKINFSDAHVGYL